jgi:hypothetical protein
MMMIALEIWPVNAGSMSYKLGILLADFNFPAKLA